MTKSVFSLAKSKTFPCSELRNRTNRYPEMHIKTVETDGQRKRGEQRIDRGNAEIGTGDRPEIRRQNQVTEHQNPQKGDHFETQTRYFPVQRVQQQPPAAGTGNNSDRNRQDHGEVEMVVENGRCIAGDADKDDMPQIQISAEACKKTPTHRKNSKKTGIDENV